jgi:hypothetical protein
MGGAPRKVALSSRRDFHCFGASQSDTNDSSRGLRVSISIPDRADPSAL